jgi:hypothetical protein
MARIKIEDIPDNIKLNKEEMKKVLGGLETRLSITSLQNQPILTNAAPNFGFIEIPLSSLSSNLTNASPTNAVTGFK